MTDLLLVLAGLVALAVGGEALVRGALAAARRMGVSALMAGLVIVGFSGRLVEYSGGVTGCCILEPAVWYWSGGAPGNG